MIFIIVSIQRRWYLATLCNNCTCIGQYFVHQLLFNTHNIVFNPFLRLRFVILSITHAIKMQISTHALMNMFPPIHKIYVFRYFNEKKMYTFSNNNQIEHFLVWSISEFSWKYLNLGKFHIAIGCWIFYEYEWCNVTH